MIGAPEAATDVRRESVRASGRLCSRKPSSPPVGHSSRPRACRFLRYSLGEDAPDRVPLDDRRDFADGTGGGRRRPQRACVAGVAAARRGRAGEGRARCRGLYLCHSGESGGDVREDEGFLRSHLLCRARPAQRQAVRDADLRRQRRPKRRAADRTHRNRLASAAHCRSDHRLHACRVRGSHSAAEAHWRTASEVLRGAGCDIGLRPGAGNILARPSKSQEVASGAEVLAIIRDRLVRVPTMLDDFIHWLGATPVSQLIQRVFWIIPTVQAVHILAISVVLASMAMFDLRLLGLAGRRNSIASLSRRFMPWLWSALIVLAVSGSILIVG